MIKATLDVKATVKALRALRDRLRDLRPMFTTALAYLRKATDQQFSSQGARSGDTWPPLSRPYSEWKAIRYPGQPILRATDKLYKSLVQKTSDSVEKVNRQSLTYGTKRKYARFHQRGTPRMPMRKILAITATDRAELKRLARLHLEQQSTLSGFHRT